MFGLGEEVQKKIKLIRSALLCLSNEMKQKRKLDSFIGFFYNIFSTLFVLLI